MTRWYEVVVLAAAVALLLFGIGLAVKKGLDCWRCRGG
jgi:hypothetical protein